MEVELSRPQFDIFNSRAEISAFIAGQGSGKTHVAGLVAYTLIKKFPRVRGLICANTHGQLNRATLKNIRDLWKEFGLTEYSDANPKGVYVIGKIPPKHFNTENHNFERYDNIISFLSGAVVYVGSLEKYKNLDGIEIGWAVLDETKDTREEAVKEVILGRIRQGGMYVDKDGNLCHDTTQKPFNPLYIFTSPAKVPWLNEWFNLDEHEQQIREVVFDKDKYFKLEEEGRLVTISSTYHNEKNLPAGWIESRKKNLNSGLINMLIYGFPFGNSGGECYKDFDRQHHVKPTTYRPDLPLWLSWDENVLPYLTCLVWQVEGKEAWQLGEICLESPRNKVSSVCREFKRLYPKHDSGLFITGDRTSKKDDTKLERGQNFFTLIRQQLREYNPIVKLPSKNPSVVQRINFINTIFEKGFRDISLKISPNCPKTISDYTYLKEADDGTKKKERVTDKEKNISYEKYGHCTDANDYFICQVFRTDFLYYCKGEGTSGAKVGPRRRPSKKY